MVAFRPLHNLFENVLNRETGSDETRAIAMHRLEQAPAGLVQVTVPGSRQRLAL